jgi:hypothetical protein
MTKPSEKQMPAFVFNRRRHVELETGRTLAGQLIVDIPRNTRRPTRRQQRLISDIVQQLVEAAQSGRMPDDALVWGWHGGVRPANADEIQRDHALMDAWVKTRLIIGLRVDPRSDGAIQVDSDMRRQLNLLDS